jgi:beta-alanine degradation protein BauB
MQPAARRHRTGEDQASDMAFKCTVPAVPTVQQDDETVRITRWDFEPGAATGWHTHGWPYFVVLLTDALMKVHDGKSETAVALKAGQSYSRPAGIEHDVMNGSAQRMAFVEIEIKRPEALMQLRRP